MVYLNRIYTRAGDDGSTRLGDGTLLSKTHPRIAAYGSVDELNSVLGLVLAAPDLPGELALQLRSIQNDLFDLGADLCVPESVESAHPPLRMAAGQVEMLEHWIDAAVERLAPLDSFILPGGAPAAAHLHHARTVCRRTEIAVLHLAEFEEINPQATIYLNRLSDLLFVLARLCNDGGAADVKWVPGQSRGGEAAA